MARKILQRPTHITRKDMEHAAESAREMVAQDATLQHLVNFLIISRRLYMVGRSALDNEIKMGWEDVENPELIIQTLVMSCQEKSNEKFKILDLQRSVLQEIVPVLDIFVQQALDTGHDIDETPTEKEDESEVQSDGERGVSGSDAGTGTGCDEPVAGAEAGEHRGREVAGEEAGETTSGGCESGTLADDRVHPGTVPD